MKTTLICYKTSSNKIEWSDFEGVEEEDGRKIIRFTDGGWIHAENGFFTEDQCLRYHKAPALQVRTRHNEIADSLERLAKTLR